MVGVEAVVRVGIKAQAMQEARTSGKRIQGDGKEIGEQAGMGGGQLGLDDGQREAVKRGVGTGVEGVDATYGRVAG